MVVYIAGPITNLPEFNRPAFFAAAARLRGTGKHFVFMPRKAKGEQASHYSVNSISSLWNTTIRLSGVRRRRPNQTRHTYACWMLSAGANPASIANQMGHENAEMVYTVYSAWINALDGDQIAFLNQRIGGYSSVPQVPPEVDAL